MPMSTCSGLVSAGGSTHTAIKAVTSDIELLADGSNFADAGFTTTTSYETLAKTLKKIAVQLCAPSLTITKVVTSADNPEPTPADGWTFATTITIPQGDGQWVKPGTDAITVGVPSTKSLATSQSGAANFQWLPDGELVTDPVIVKETQKVGYAVQPDLKCSAKNLVEDTQRDFTATLASDGTWNLGAIDPLEIVTCTATNVLKDTGSVKITKEFNAQGSGYAGTFDVAYKCVDGSDLIAEGTAALAAGNSKTLSGLPTGTVVHRDRADVAGEPERVDVQPADVQPQQPGDHHHQGPRGHRDRGQLGSTGQPGRGEEDLPDQRDAAQAAAEVDGHPDPDRQDHDEEERLRDAEACRALPPADGDISR